MKVFSKIAVAIALFLSTQLSAQVSVFGDPIFDQSVTQAEINNAGPVFSQQTVLFPSTQTFLFNGTSQKEIRATDHIKIQPGFKSGTYSGAGKMKLTVAPSPFDVAVMNYVDGVQHVLKYEKLELGVVLPTDIAAKVTNFVNNVVGDKLNPYLDWELRVYAVFTHPNEAQPIIVDGFYTKEFTSWMLNPIPDLAATASCPGPCYNSLGGYTPNNNLQNYPFRVRFAPPRTGVWKAKIVIETNNSSISSSEFEFNVFESGNPGYIKVGTGGRFLSYNGETFIPIGCNAAWPETNDIHDPELAWKTHELDALGNPITSGEGYRADVYALPRVYDKYKEVLQSMVNNGANYFRTIMCPTATDIEWEKLGNYTQRLHMAQEMDEILELAEQEDFFLHWNMQLHYNFQDSENAYHRRWTWNDIGPGRLFCYRDPMLGTTDGFSFLSNTEAKRYYKQRLRYILARWGYSTNIAVFELFSEISNIGAPEADNSDFYQTGTNWQAYRDWQVEMGNYIKTMYNGKIHPLTTNFAGYKHNEDNVFNYSCFDVMTSNIYDFEATDFGKHFNDNVSKIMLDDAGTPNSYTKVMSPSTTNNIKPLIFSEMDPVHSKSNPFEPNNCGIHVEDLRRSIWQAPFSGLAGGLSWVAWYYPELYPTFGHIRNFISGIDFDGENWNPGASLRSANNWNYESSYTDQMGENKKADVVYLRSGTGNFVIGVISNKTFNTISNSNCLVNETWNSPNLLPEWYSLSGIQLGSIQNADLEQQDVALKGLNNDKYYINYFLSGTSYGTPIHSSDDTQLTSTGKIKLEYNVAANENYYLIPFMARRQGQNWLPTLNDENDEVFMSNATLAESNELANNEVENTFVKVYPNPTKNTLFIETGRLTGEFLLTLETLDGRMIKNQLFEAGLVNCSIAEIVAGTYIVKVSQNGILLEKKRIVKL
jgi:hypothetical protein